jgi:hypothetical protein
MWHTKPNVTNDNTVIDPNVCKHDSFRLHKTTSDIYQSCINAGQRPPEFIGKCLKCNKRCKIVETYENDLVIDGGWFD